MSVTAYEIPPRPLRWWDLACAGVLAFIAVVVVVDGAAGDPHWAIALHPGWRIAILLAPMLFVVVLYVMLGRSVLARGMVDLPRSSLPGVRHRGHAAPSTFGASASSPKYSMALRSPRQLGQ